MSEYSIRAAYGPCVNCSMRFDGGIAAPPRFFQKGIKPYLTWPWELPESLKTPGDGQNYPRKRHFALRARGQGRRRTCVIVLLERVTTRRDGGWGVRAFRNPGFVRVAAIVVGALFALAFFRYLFSGLPLLDLYAHLDGARDWYRGLDPYNLYLSHKPGEIGGGYVFPPYTLPFFLTLDSIPRPMAASLWTAAGVGALSWLIWDISWPQTYVRLAAATVLATSFSPLLANFGLGQVGIFVLSGAWVAFRLASRGSEARAGLGLALASAFKLFPLLAGATLLMRGRWRSLFFAFAVLTGAVVITWPLVGSLWYEYITGVLVGHVGSTSPSPGNQSIAAALVRTLTVNAYERPLVVFPTLAAIMSVALPLGVFTGVLVAARHRPHDRLQDALLLACLPLVVPNAWQHYYVLSLPLLWLVLSNAVSARDWKLLALGLIALTALSWIPSTIDLWYFRVANEAPSWNALYANSSVIGGLMLVLTGAYILNRKASAPPSASWPHQQKATTAA
jgi:hypothetical protein